MRRIASLLLLTALAMTAVGCAGGGGISWIAFLALLLSANLTLVACGTDDETTSTASDSAQSDTADAGLGDITVNDSVATDIEECDGAWEQTCSADGELVKVCCPNGMACNYGMGLTICDDGSCVDYPDTCPEDEDVTEPDVWDKDASDEDGGDKDAWDKDVPEKDVPDKDVPDKDVSETDVPDKDVPEKDVPDKDVPEKDVPDKDISDGDVEECDGTWESMCNEFGEVDQACCPEGVACNYGMTMVICEDGSCVNMPDTCEDKEPECDGTWEQMCNEDGQVEKVCCPAGVACNYGMGMVICKDGSCVVQPDTCPDDK